MDQKTAPKDRVRLDKWLWAARFYKTRALACEAISKGRVSVNGLPAKASREMHAGDQIALRQGDTPLTVLVKALSDRRGPAPQAQALYEETADSVTSRLRAAELRRLAPEPAVSIEQGRPTKRDRRDLDRTQVEWHRWSAAIDEKSR